MSTISGIFSGYSSLEADAKPAAVTGTMESRAGQSSAQATKYEGSSSVAKTLGIDASVNYSEGAVAKNNASIAAKVDFLESLNLTSYSVTILVVARQVSQVTSVSSGLKLANDVLPPKDNTGTKNFFIQHGDTYVSQTNMGGEYIGAFVFHCETEEEKKSFSSSIDGKINEDGAEFSGSLQDSLNSITQSTSIYYTFNQIISGWKLDSSVNESNLINYANQLLSKTIDNKDAALLSFDTSSYSEVPALTDHFATIDANRKLFFGDNFSSGLLASRQKIVDLQAQIATIRSIYQFYNIVKNDADLAKFDPTLSSTYKDSVTDIDSIQTIINNYNLDPTQDLSSQVHALRLTSLSVGTPNLSTAFTHQSSDDGYGTPGGGQDFNDLEDLRIQADYFESKTYISAVSIRAGNRINQLMTSYTRARENNQSLTLTSEKHGGEGGQQFPAFTLQASEFISGLEVATVEMTNRRISQLILTSTRGQHSSYGMDGTPSSVPYPENSILIGFAGNSDIELDTFRPLFGSISPATWTQ